MYRFCLPIVLLALLSGCAQQGAAPASQSVQSSSAGADGLQPRASGLDSVAAAFAFDLSGAKVYLQPVSIDYSKRFSDPAAGLRAKDYELDARDLQRMQDLMAQTFSERFLAPRGSQLVADPQQADYTLQLSLERFSLGAPLDPQPWLWRVYTDQSAYGVLTGQLYDRDGNLVMRFSDRRDIGGDYGGFATGNVERFTSVTFWTDMKVDLRRAFGSLDRALR